ncbi:MAG TPA: hypothetical protein VGV64_03250 [Thermoplasmata archaeon]|nr:hypothetical protein [Thermoplasmata archaeon]
MLLQGDAPRRKTRTARPMPASPGRAAFILTLPRQPEPGEETWPHWLSSYASPIAPDPARSAAYDGNARARRSSRTDDDPNDPRLPLGNPAPAGA